ncbi:MAG: hypothetical protein Q9167_005793 [Letrouitia subvulpina]
MSTSQDSLPATNGKNKTSSNAHLAGKPSKHQLDLTKLHSLPSEQQDLYLFTFVTNFEAYVTSLSQEALCSQQRLLSTEIHQIINLSSPIPTRVTRNCLGRCLAHVLGRGDRKTLYDTINQLVAVINASKIGKQLHNRHAAVHCLGEVYKSAGDSAITLSSIAASSLLRLLKTAQNHVGLRAAIFKALEKIVGVVRRSLDETIAKDIWKHARTAASGDKAALVQANACWCIEQLVMSTSYFDTVNDFDSLKSSIWKVCESPVPVARRSAASCLAAVMTKSYVADAASKPNSKVKRSKKPTKIQPPSVEEDETPSRSASPSAKRNSIKLELSLSDLLSQLSAQYIRSSTSNRARSAIAHCYIKVFKNLDSDVIRSHYDQIMDHLLIDILSSPSIVYDRYRMLLTRKYVQKILADCIGAGLLAETGRLNAAKTLINKILKNYPQVLKERPEPAKQTLVGALNALSSLIQSLGSVFGPLVDGCRDALVHVLHHPSYTVQTHASYCLRTMVLACPQQLLTCASICMNSLSRELGLLTTGRQSPRRCVGFANGLAAVISVSPQQPLYSSLEISSRVLSIATDLLKSSSKVELRVSSTQVQVAWILIGGLMSLGPNFVKIHISQLLLLWRNALPRPLPRENTAQRDLAELSYLTHVRECALGSILSFLKSNNRLMTLDVSNRTAVLLQNTIDFLDTLPKKKFNDDPSLRASYSLSLQDLIIMVRRRLLQCYTRLITTGPMVSSEALTESNLLTLAMTMFADPESYLSGSLGASITNSVGTFESIWDIEDNSGFGITGLVRGEHLRPLPAEMSSSGPSPWIDKTGEHESLDLELLAPAYGALEHDSVCLLREMENDELPDPPATEVVNSAIALFAMTLPLQSPKIQEGVLEQLATVTSTSALQRNPGRKAAIMVNTAMALLSALKVAVGETSAESGDLRSVTVEKCLQGLIYGFVTDQDRFIRNLGYQALGRLCSSSGNSFTTNEVNNLINAIVSNRDPNARAGFAMSLGSIHSQIGGMAAGFHLKKIHGVLMSLCSDPHPAVHFCAIRALSQVADSAGLAFSAYVPSTLGLMAQLWSCETHNEEFATLATSNYELEQPTSIMIAHCVDSLINVLGPDLQDMEKARDLMVSVMQQFVSDSLPMVQAEGLRCWEHMHLYDSGHMQLAGYIRLLQQSLESQHACVRENAVDGLYSLVRRDASQIFQFAGDGFEERLWLTLNDFPELDGLRNLIHTWLGQTSLDETPKWVSRLQQVLTKTAAKQIEQDVQLSAKADAEPELQDEEIAGFASGENKSQESQPIPEAAQELLRWQVRAFTLQCLSDFVAIVGKDMLLDSESASGNALQQKIADVIRMAFLASTSSVVELRIGGLKLINQILTIFGSTPDPDFSEALLLEQYQAQISTALTPAFNADSSPELASAAVSVCATFTATGMVKDIDRMGRILKLLVAALDSFSSEAKTETSIGELRGLSSNAQTMVRMAVLSAWAELQVSSAEQKYLSKVIEPHIGKLTSLWLLSLQEFARLRFEPDISSNTGPAGTNESLEVIYAALNRQTLLEFYQASWLKLVDAIATLIERDSDFVFDALDGRRKDSQANGVKSPGPNINYRDEPVAFFFVLFGIVIEALVTRSSNESPTDVLRILSALKKILSPSVSGNAVYQETVFSETIELLDRLALTEGFEIQTIVVEIAKNLCITHPAASDADQVTELSEDVEQIFELSRIIVLVLTNILPNIANPKAPVRETLTDEATTLIKNSLESLVEASEIFPSIIKSDLYATIFHIYTVILSTPACQAAVIPQTLPVFRRFVQSTTDSNSLDSSSSISSQVQGCLHRFLAILGIAQRRELESSLSCAKNTLLATTILFTTASNTLSPNAPLVKAAMEAMLDCLQDLGLAKMVSSCLRSLTLVPSKNPTDEAIARYLFTRLVHFAADVEQSDPENARAIVLQTLTAFVNLLSEDNDKAAAAMTVVLSALLGRASKEGSIIYKMIAARVMELANERLMTTFRSVVAALDPEQRAFMEKILKEGGASPGGVNKNTADGAAGSGEPSIALKLSFGM